MKLEEILLVVENDKGTETGFLMDFDHYFTVMQGICGENVQELGKSIQELYRTRENTVWTDLYAAANKSYHARFCGSEEELKAFLAGGYGSRAEKTYLIDTNRSTQGCLDVIEARGISHQGIFRYWDMKYEEMSHDFRQGETLHDFQGREYQVLRLIDKNDLLLMAVPSQEECQDSYFLAAMDVRIYRRYPKEGVFSPDSLQYGIEWEQEVYLGSDIAAINLEEAISEHNRNRRSIPSLDDEYEEER